MPSQTAGRALPFPLGTDRVMDGDDQIRKLAQSVDNMIQVVAISSGNLVAGTALTIPYTWPTPFADIPFVVVSQQANAAALQGGSNVSSLGATAVGGNVLAYRQTGTAGILVLIVGIGKVTPVA